MMQVLEKKSEDYVRIEDYIQNTHAKTHQQYELKLEDVCCITLHY
jgi:hypothetical protein